MFELWSRFLGFRRFFSAGHFEPDIPRKFVRLLGVLETFSKRKKEMIAIGEIRKFRVKPVDGTLPKLKPVADTPLIASGV
jgi:hypothetical protein